MSAVRSRRAPRRLLVDFCALLDTYVLPSANLLKVKARGSQAAESPLSDTLEIMSWLQNVISVLRRYYECLIRARSGTAVLKQRVPVKYGRKHSTLAQDTIITRLLDQSIVWFLLFAHNRLDFQQL